MLRKILITLSIVASFAGVVAYSTKPVIPVAVAQEGCGPDNGGPCAAGSHCCLIGGSGWCCANGHSCGEDPGDCN